MLGSKTPKKKSVSQNQLNTSGSLEINNRPVSYEIQVVDVDEELKQHEEADARDFKNLRSNIRKDAELKHRDYDSLDE